jgi:FtsP/CotA-like multicopper oxidase with cupredoxin domain
MSMSGNGNNDQASSTQSLDGSSNATGGNRTFSYLGPNTASLNVRMNGSQIMADGAAIPTWFFGDGFNGDRTVPGPVIEAIEGESVQVTLSSDMPHSIHFHGLDVDQANDGVPSTSGYVARMGGGGMMNFGRVRGYTNLGSPFTYRFTAPHAGTYAYHCHVDTVLHFEMGMYGTVIIRPPDGRADIAWQDGPAFDKEYIWHLHTFDSSWHSGMGGMGGMGSMVSGPGTVRHRPDYFMINGRDGNDTLTDPATAIEAGPGQQVLIRLNNVGYQPALVQLGELEFEVIASDGRPLAQNLRTNSLMIAPGERYDILLAISSPGDWTAIVDYYHIRGDATLLGTATTSIKAICKGDFDEDGDVDGKNLSDLVNDEKEITLKRFAREFGRVDCN